MAVETDYIALSASIAAVLTAIATFFTVWQIKKQREAAYRPDLTLPLAMLKGSPPSQEALLPIAWRQHDPKNSIQSPLQFSTTLHNVGLGAARDIQVAWRLQTHMAIAKINQLSALTAQTISFSQDDISISIAESDERIGAIFTKNDLVQSIDYVLPASADPTGGQLRIPATFVHICSALLYLTIAQQSKRFDLDLPRATLDLSYRDIADSFHHVSFEVSLQISMISAQATPGSMNFCGFLEFRKIRT
jgi:hypothetical protein